MWEPWTYNVDIPCPSKVTIPDSGNSVTKVGVEEVGFHVDHSGVVYNNVRHGVAIALNET